MRCQELEVPYGNHTAAAAALDAHARAAVAGDQAERVVRTLQHTVTPLVPPWACPFPGHAKRGSSMSTLWCLRHTGALACIEVGECVLCLVDHPLHVHYISSGNMHCTALHCIDVSRRLQEARASGTWAAAVAGACNCSVVMQLRTSLTSILMTRAINAPAWMGPAGKIAGGAGSGGPD